MTKGRSRPRAVSVIEYEQVMAECERAATENRGRYYNHRKNRLRAIQDQALLALTFNYGLRFCELQQLRLSDYLDQSRGLVIRGRWPRSFTLEGDTAERLEAWIDQRSALCSTLFYELPRGRDWEPRPLGQRNVNFAIHRRCNAASVRRFSLQDLRRAYTRRGKRSTD